MTTDSACAGARSDPHRRGTIHHWRMAALALLVLASTMVAPALFSGKILSTLDVISARDPSFHDRLKPQGVYNPLKFDSAYVFEPDFVEARRQLREGHLPLWTTGIGGGRPLLASQQHAALYPLNWLAIALPTERAAALILLLKVFVAGLGVLLLSRSLGLAPLPGLLAATAFATSAYFTSWLLHPHTNVYLLLPWMLYACNKISRGGDRLATLVLASLIGLAALGGHPESAAIVVGFTSAYLIWLTCPAKAVCRRAIALRGTAALVAGLGLGAIVLLPFMEAASVGSQLGRGGFGAPLWSLLTLIAPDYWGSPEQSVQAARSLNYSERTIYLGIAPLLLACGAALVRPSRPERFFIWALVVSLLLAVAVPGVNDAVHALPGADFLNLVRAFLCVEFCLAMLAAFGLQKILDGSNAAGKVTIGAAAALLAGCVVAALLSADLSSAVPSLGRALSGTAPDRLADLAPTAFMRGAAGGLVVLCLVSLTRIRRGLAGGAVATTLILVTAVDLYGVNQGHQRFLDPEEVSYGAPTAVLGVRPANRLDRVTAQGLLGPNLALRYKLLDPRSHDHPVIARYHALWTSLVADTEARTEFVNDDEQARKALDLFSVRQVLFNGRRGSRQGLVRPRRLSGGFYVSVNPAPLPRAFVATSWEGASGPDDALSRVVRADRGVLRERPIIEGVGSSVRAPTPANAQRILHYGTEKVDIQVETPSAGHLVLTDTYFPGWTAELDGRPVPIRPANVTFRAVEVPPGRHRVSFVYDAPVAKVGATLSLLSLITLALAAFGPLKRRRAKFAQMLAPAGEEAIDWKTRGKAVRIRSARAVSRLRTRVGAPPRDKHHGE